MTFTPGNRIAFEYNGKHRVGRIVKTTRDYITMDMGYIITVRHSGRDVRQFRTFTKDKIEGKIRICS